MPPPQPASPLSLSISVSAPSSSPGRRGGIRPRARRAWQARPGREGGAPFGRSRSRRCGGGVRSAGSVPDADGARRRRRCRARFVASSERGSPAVFREAGGRGRWVGAAGISLSSGVGARAFGGGTRRAACRRPERLRAAISAASTRSSMPSTGGCTPVLPTWRSWRVPSAAPAPSSPSPTCTLSWQCSPFPATPTRSASSQQRGERRLATGHTG